jgi:hypothetical protein
MATTIKLGKHTTVSNVTGVVDASMKIEVEKVDATTRGASGVYKRTVAGLMSRTLEVTAIGDYTHTYGEQKSVVVSVSGSAAFSMTGVVTNVKRSEPIGDKITNTLTIKPGEPLDNADQIDI